MYTWPSRSLNTDEIIEILDRLDSNNDIIMGFPDGNDLSDGDTPAHIEQDEDEDEMEENIPSNSKKHARRRLRKDDRECPISQSVITLPPSNLLSEIVFQTNLYAFQKNKNLDLTISELKVFIGGLLLSATCPLPNKRKYWSSKDNVPKLLANSMRRDRLIDILHNIHFHDNTLETNDRARFCIGMRVQSITSDTPGNVYVQEKYA
ncbi:unnamed protein product [Lepeophtheirus salmonis]|uniref:(salmon louse) hypothetical protein n=1 Tax=Lepeophtheirus salmonis TaxID=72036 RepID=A0A7R8CFT4_LEPSM|nr:unnamed protein product [Lepeophtheirus salmonis]CAF2805408.1 unnamed protein product [Lepeophtheirus salmonis]